VAALSNSLTASLNFSFIVSISPVAKLLLKLEINVLTLDFIILLRKVLFAIIDILFFADFVFAKSFTSSIEFNFTTKEIVFQGLIHFLLYHRGIKFVNLFIIIRGGDLMLQTIIRFIVSAIVLLVVGYLVPGFSVAGFWGALISALVIALLGYIVELILGKDISPRSRGFVGFIVAAVVIYVSQFIVPTIHATIVGSLIAAFVIGLVDAFVPTELR